MQIKKLTIENFRNIQGTLEILFEKNHTIVFGANGAGKSNIPLAIAFVLNCDKKFLGIREYVDFINEAQEQSARGRVCCTVRLEVKEDRRQKLTVIRTLNVESESVYAIDNVRVTEVEYMAKLRELRLQATAMLFPQRFANPEVMSGPFGYGTFLESLVEFFNELEFSSEEEKELQELHRTASRLKKRIRLQQLTIDQIERLQSQTVGSTENLEEQITRAERLLVLAKLWKVNESKRKHVLKLEELKTSDVESRRDDAEKQIAITQNEISVIKAKLEDFHQKYSQESSRVEELRTKKIRIAQLSASRDRLQQLIAEAQELVRIADGPRTEVKEKLLREIQQVETLNTRAAWLYDKMKSFDAKFRTEHPQEIETLQGIEKELECRCGNRAKIQRFLQDTRRRRSRAKEEMASLKEHIEALARDKKNLETKLDIEKSFLERHDKIVDGMQALMTRKRTRLSTLRRSRISTIQRSMAAARDEFELRCLISGICEYFEDDLPASPVYGLLRDMIKPKDEAHKRAFYSFLGKRLDSIVVKNQDVRTLVKSLLEEDSQYRAPRTPVIVLPKEGVVAKRSGKGVASYRRRGIIPLADTWVVSDKYKGDQRMSNRIKRLIKDLASDALFCSDDASAKEISSENRETHPAVKAVTPDGTVCSSSGTLTFSSTHEALERSGPDGLRRTQDFEREILALESFLRREPVVALLLHRCLQHRLRVSINGTESLLGLKNVLLQEATGNLRRLESSIRDMDEVSRNAKDELEMFRGGEETMKLRKERARINLIKMQNIKNLKAVNIFSHSEISDALEQNRKENFLEQDYLLNELLEMCEEDRENQWNSLMRQEMETSGRARLEKMLEQIDSTLRANEEAERQLMEITTRQESREVEKQHLIESLESSTARLSELFKITKKLSREAATNSLNQRRQVLSLSKLQRRRRELIRKLNGEAPDGLQDDDVEIEDVDDSSPELELDEERLLDPVPPVDYTELPQNAKASERSMIEFMKSTRQELASFRYEEIKQRARADGGDAYSANTLEAGLRSKTEALTQFKETLRAKLEEIKIFERKKTEFNARRNELLKDLYEKLPSLVAEQFAKLSRCQITMNLRKPSDDTFVGSDVRFHLEQPGSELTNRGYQPIGEAVIVLLSVVLAVQEIFGVPSLILDEIDARTSSSVSKKLHSILSEHAQSKQVICISHQPKATPERGVWYIGVIRCQVSACTKVLHYDPEISYTDRDHKFPGKLTQAAVEYVSTKDIEDTPPRAEGEAPIH